MNKEIKGLTYQGKPRTYGLRFSITDFITIVIAGLSNCYLWSLVGELSLIIAYVVFHFFLFCNVFRVKRKPELIWAGLFIVSAYVWIGYLDPSILGLVLTTFPFTVVLIFFETRTPSYHGVFAKQINNSLEDYLSGKV